ncbi:MAG: VOC family protein [Micropruina sp.]|nr:VOC family protein [Micropruina sp.]
MAIAKTPTLVIDCPDAPALARFYGELLGWRVDNDNDWSEVGSDDGQRICFQQVDDYRAPQWPGQQVPQQTHLDVVVESLDDAEMQVLALGATLAGHQPGTTFRVFLDPAGHPFCLCLS